MNTSITNQIPNEAMFYEGRLTLSWLMFFQRLAKLADLVSASNLLELIQLANLQPTQAIQGEQAQDIDILQRLAQNPPIPIAAEQTHPLPLSQVAFFCASETLPVIHAAMPKCPTLPSMSLSIINHSQSMPNSTPQQMTGCHDMPILSIPDEFLQVINP